MVRLGMITNKIDYKVYSNKPFAIWANSRIINERLSANSYNQDYLDFAKAKNIFNFKKVSDIAKVTAMIGWKGLTTDDYVDEDGVYLLRTVDIKNNYIDLENTVMAKREKVYEQPQIILKQGDIIFSKDGTLGITAIVPSHQNREMCVGSTLARIRLNSNLDNYYVCAVFMSKIVQVQIRYFTSGIAQPHITQEYINKLEVPIPSPEIQKYIGDKVRKAEELREKAKRLKKEAEDILAVELGFRNLQEKLCVYKEKFSWIKVKELRDRIDGEFYKTDFILNNEHIDALRNNGIQILRLKDIIDKGSYGILPSSDDYGKGEVVLLRSTNLKEFLIDDSDVIKVPEYYYKEKVQVNEGDILLEIKGQCYSGAIATELKNKTIVNGSIYKFSVNKGINNYYILAYLLSKSGKLQKRQNLANSIISYLSIDCINNLKVPVVSIEKQQIIGGKYKAYVEQMNKSKQLIQEAKQDVEDLIEGNFDVSKVKANN